jgi:hypothetical protein
MKKEKEEKRKQQIRDIMNKTTELRDLILNSVDYTRYRRQLEELKQSEEQKYGNHQNSYNCQFIR